MRRVNLTLKGLLSSCLLLRDDAVEIQRGEDRQRVKQALDGLVRVKVGVNVLPMSQRSLSWSKPGTLWVLISKK